MCYHSASKANDPNGVKGLGGAALVGNHGEESTDTVHLFSLEFSPFIRSLSLKRSLLVIWKLIGEALSLKFTAQEDLVIFFVMVANYTGIGKNGFEAIDLFGVDVTLEMGTVGGIEFI